MKISAALVPLGKYSKSLYLDFDIISYFQWGNENSVFTGEIYYTGWNKVTIQKCLTVYFLLAVPLQFIHKAAAAEFSLLKLTQHEHNYTGPLSYLYLLCN